MSAIGTLRANVLTAIGAILPTGTKIVEARAPAASFGVAAPSEPPVVVLSYVGRPKRKEGPLGNRKKQGYTYVFTIAVIDADWQTPAGAIYSAADLAETLIGAPNAAPGTLNLREYSLGKIGDEEVFLCFVSETAELDPGSTAQGGRCAIVQTWETNKVFV